MYHTLVNRIVIQEITIFEIIYTYTYSIYYVIRSCLATPLIFFLLSDKSYNKQKKSPQNKMLLKFTIQQQNEVSTGEVTEVTTVHRQRNPDLQTAFLHIQNMAIPQNSRT